ncbi:MAG TPA: response regulator [Gemmatimonadales bacterium]|jgi:two-component system cell cycle sensor histidine kinase/response regulator CckA|nr:response regulator [Gemmatimonadales bacterium]
MAQILVVDDEELVRRFAARVLRGRGYTVAEAGDGRKALAKVEELGSALRLVLSDIVMPYLNGVELTERLSVLRPDLPVILMSGYSPRELMARGIAAPCALLSKPFLPSELIAEVSRCLDVTAA